jgi:hypothetical protein
VAFVGGWRGVDGGALCFTGGQNGLDGLRCRDGNVGAADRRMDSRRNRSFVDHTSVMILISTMD